MSMHWLSFRENWQYALLAMALAVVCWYYVSGREAVESWVEVPVQLSGAPEDMVVQSGLRNRIDVRVRGPKGMIHNLENRALVYALDLSGIDPGMNDLELSSEGLNLAAPYEVVEVRPSRLQVLADKLVFKELSIQPEWQGNLEQDYELARTEVQPASVTVRGPQRYLAMIENVSTRPVPVNATRPGVVEGRVGLRIPDTVKLGPDESGEVRVRLEFELKTTPVELAVPVTVESRTQHEVTLQPSKVRLTVALPASLAEDKTLHEDVTAHVTIDSFLPLGEHRLPYRVHTPERGYLLNAEPETVTVILK